MSKHPRYKQLDKAIVMNRRAVRMGILRTGDRGLSYMVLIRRDEVDKWKEEYGDRLKMIEE